MSSAGKKPRQKKRPSARPNLAAKALRTPLFRPRVPDNPKAYRRKGRYAPKPLIADEES
jgi:stalled ribosome alternative rescue factor ArfA